MVFTGIKKSIPDAGMDFRISFGLVVNRYNMLHKNRALHAQGFGIIENVANGLCIGFEGG
jgi:hypothetical protein